MSDAFIADRRESHVEPLELGEVHAHPGLAGFVTFGDRPKSLSKHVRPGFVDPPAPRMRYTEALLRALPRLDDDRNVRLQSIEGRPPDLHDPPMGCRFAPRCPHADARCVGEAPPLSGNVATAHRYACWHPAESLEPALEMPR